MTRRQIDYEDWTGLPQRDTILPRRFNDVADGGGGIPGLQRLIAMNTMNRTWNYLLEGCSMVVNTMGEGWGLINGKITHIPSQTLSPTASQVIVVNDAGQASSVAIASIDTYASDPEYLILYFYTGTVYNDIAPRVKDRSGSTSLPLDVRSFVESRRIGGKITFVDHSDLTLDLVTLDADGLVVTDGADSISIKNDEIDINGVTYFSEKTLQLNTDVSIVEDSGDIDVSVAVDKEIALNVGTEKLIVDVDSGNIRIYPVENSRLGIPVYQRTWSNAYINEIQSKQLKFYETDTDPYPTGGQRGEVSFDFTENRLNVNTLNASHPIRFRTGASRGITISDNGTNTLLLPVTNVSVNIGSDALRINEIRSKKAFVYDAPITDNEVVRLVDLDDIEHGNLLGLDDDDHDQYILANPGMTDNSIVRWDGTNGRVQQDSSVTINDNDQIANLAAPTSGNHATNKTYVDDEIESAKNIMGQVVEVIGYFATFSYLYANWTYGAYGNEMLLRCNSAGSSNLKMPLISPPFTNRVLVKVFGIQGNMDFWVDPNNKGTQTGYGPASVSHAANPDAEYVLELDPTSTPMKTTRMYVIWYRT